ncbi:MAG: hypothetical protein ABF743_11020 [Schleiferilactobacillus perolens]|uniref:hypothetical protein n=1 Tax=Schleiferilactobacillus perolens TaxID=100468 RepID=UPI0039EAF42A
MKKIEPTPMEDWALQQQVSHYQTMTPVLGSLRQSFSDWIKHSGGERDGKAGSK